MPSDLCQGEKPFARICLSPVHQFCHPHCRGWFTRVVQKCLLPKVPSIFMGRFSEWCQSLILVLKAKAAGSVCIQQVIHHAFQIKLQTHTLFLVAPIIWMYNLLVHVTSTRLASLRACLLTARNVFHAYTGSTRVQGKYVRLCPACSAAWSREYKFISTYYNLVPSFTSNQVDSLTTSTHWQKNRSVPTLLSHALTVFDFATFSLSHFRPRH